MGTEEGAAAALGVREQAAVSSISSIPVPQVIKVACVTLCMTYCDYVVSDAQESESECRLFFINISKFFHVVFSFLLATPLSRSLSLLPSVLLKPSLICCFTVPPSILLSSIHPSFLPSTFLLPPYLFQSPSLQSAESNAVGLGVNRTATDIRRHRPDDPQSHEGSHGRSLALHLLCRTRRHLCLSGICQQVTECFAVSGPYEVNRTTHFSPYLLTLFLQHSFHR
jgi:hypothetical protein